VSDARVTSTPHPGATPENELNALACVYRFVLERHAAKTAAAEGFRPKLEGGVDGSLTKEPNENVVSTPVARTRVSQFPRD
jgi:hypothetical protein